MSYPINENVKQQILTALRKEAGAGWAGTQAVRQTLRKAGHRLSRESVRHYLSLLAAAGMVEAGEREAHRVWRINA